MSSHASPSQPSSDPRQAQPLQTESPPMSHGQGPSSTKTAAFNSTSGDTSEIHEDNGRSPEIQGLFSTSQQKRDLLFEKVMNGEWDAVINIYKSDKFTVQMAGITRSEETALHVAITSNQKWAAKELLSIVDGYAIEFMTDDRGENPLHLAASLGLAEICQIIVKKDEELIKTRNVDGETPLFLAALQGKNGAFYALHPKYPAVKHDLEVCRKSIDGNTILHAAIQGEYFELALQVIKWYPKLIMFNNVKGQSALHLLARNPSAFRSACHLGPLDDLLYRCLIVEPIEVDMPLEIPSDYVDKDRRVPKNYQTCSDLLDMFIKAKDHFASGWMDNIKEVAKELLLLFRSIVYFVRGRKKDNQKDAGKQLLPVKCTGKKQKQEIEVPSEEVKEEKEMVAARGPCSYNHIEDDIETAGEATRLSTSTAPYPRNYYAFFHFLQFALQLFLFLLGLGFFEVRKIKEKKRKHTLALHVMKTLVSHSKHWKYVDSGSKPHGFLEPFGGVEAPDILEKLRITEDERKEEELSSNQGAETILCDDLLQDKEQSKPMNTSLRKIIGNKNELIDLLKSQKRGSKGDMANIISKIEGKKIKVETEKMQPDVFSVELHLMDSSRDDETITPFLIAAKMGVKEMVEEILNAFPVAIRDEDKDKKNVVLLAVEKRHPKIYNLLSKKCSHLKSAFKKVDSDRNSALHLAAIVSKNKPWRIPGAALQMQWELKWYKFIKSSMPRHFFTHRNKEGKTSRELFAETHIDMVKDGGTWLTNTSQSCSVVAALIAAVAYASATTVPGGSKEGTGRPILRDQPIFNIFTISSLVALTCSVTSLTMFLTILTSRYQVSDFLQNLPTKLILGLTSLFISIAAMLVSFCAGHFFDLGDRLRHTAFPIYVLTCLPVTIYAVAQFPLYFDIIKSTIISMPKRNYEITSI